LAVKAVNGSGYGARSGARTLGLLAVSLNGVILRSLSTGPKRQVELRHESGSPAQSTLRAHLNALEGIGAILKHRRSAFPGSVEYELAEPGRELGFVSLALERWLAEAPEGPLELREEAGGAAVKALADGWSSTMLRALSARPLSLTELDSLIGALNYPSLERRLGAMRLCGLVEAVPGNGKGTPYAVTDWLRRGIGPLGAASRWERRNVPAETAAIGRIDAEAALLLALPLLQLPVGLSGACRLVVELSSGGEGESAVITALARDGRIVSCVARSEDADAWAAGSPNAWFRAAIEADPSHLELGGNSRLARALLEGLYGALFSKPMVQPEARRTR
jgi:DNA-binding HxlR family transcriptional regulator